MYSCLYTANANIKGSTLQQFNNPSSLPPVPSGHTRVVCVSDTHNEHNSIHLPPGDILIHAGDILTKSGHRHVVTAEAASGNPTVSAGTRNPPETPELQATPSGISLLQNFSHWLATQPHQHKIVIAGNHDQVLEVLGVDAVRKILEVNENTHYLCHDSVTLEGGIKVFGSPYSVWASTNRAFFGKMDYTDVPTGMSIIVTHQPCERLDDKGCPQASKADKRLTAALKRTGAQLHVCGHCHGWHGLYYTRHNIPSVCAPVCGYWMKPEDLWSEQATRGDSVDLQDGGYNPDLKYLPIVVDIVLGCGPAKHAPTVTKHNNVLPRQTQSKPLSPLATPFVPAKFANSHPDTHTGKGLDTSVEPHTSTTHDECT
eukprot:TRINITY_DN33857_c0_g1_i1.p1 TRINITY_DN33857_c0_g1~~TRINITY_DN33857_c0_g1_i1.p1  ORF type:complete len:371 (+),score=20.84 TRINITY_DN33857_c0_g1_i1:66-1178(+)